MAKGIIGKKIGMTQLFVDGEKLLPVTVVEAGPCVVTQIKNENRDGYAAVQLGFGDMKENKVNKAAKGHFELAKSDPKRYLAEFKVENITDYQLGQVVSVDTFAAGEMSDITGTSKGKGFQGVIKRWGFRGGPGGHGSHFKRAPGSIGNCASPGKVKKGKKLPGQCGDDRITVKNLEIVKVDAEKNILLIKGSVPGAGGGLLFIKVAK